MTEKEAILYFKLRLDSFDKLTGNYKNTDQYKAYELAIKSLKNNLSNGVLDIQQVSN